MGKNNVQMIALDLDGTALNEEKIISQATLDAFKKAKEKGIAIVIATGRAFQSLPKQLFEIKEIEYIITSNGAKVFRMDEQSTIRESHIKEEAVRTLLDIRKEYGASIEACISGKAYMAKEDFDIVMGANPKGRDVNYVKNTRCPVPDLEEFMISNVDEIENICFYYKDSIEKSFFYEKIKDVSNIVVTSSFSNCHEIGGEGTTKASALQYLLECHNLNKSNLMACGDSYNDLDMINMAEIGVVMGNAPDELKLMAKYITDSNINEGVSKAITKYAL